MTTNIDNFLMNVPAEARLQLPAIPVFEVDHANSGTTVHLLTRGDLAGILAAHNATEGWLIPVRPFSMDDEQAAVRMLDVTVMCIVERRKYYDSFHVPDIKLNNALIPAVLVIEPSRMVLAELTAIAHIDFIVCVSAGAAQEEADTQAMDVILIPMHSN